MKIALIGYGKMGKTIGRIAKERGHTIVSVIDVDNLADFDSPAFGSADVVIEFTHPQAAPNNYRRAFEAGIPVVSGTTGWTEQLPELKKEIIEKGYTFFWSSNFSLGVNIFMKLNNCLAEIMNRFPDYDVKMTEVHHVQKSDAPSGTAITLADDIIGRIDRKTAWTNAASDAVDELQIVSVREGQVPGMHTVRYESGADVITITHEAKSREGFARGAVLAAEFIQGKKGLWGMNDLLKF
ncbi:MAG: 4-hydroxy-tetrahydrodipicolinate reductase [Prevotellaceae bacterium]|jgi:4-hydroxy-tetrahydrodipicolinate reductase|nr:4-hydroxy-tetrahydrodipicolinate reductase [Prevotellaceae bacterium]